MMNMLYALDWRTIFVPTTNVVEIFLRGTIVYLFLFFTLRILRREAGAVGISDLLVVVLIADAAQNAMASDYKSITEGLILVSTIVFWDYFLDWLGYHSSSIRRLLRPAPLLLIKDGQLQRRNLKEEMITKEELQGLLREHGVLEMDEVKCCYLEADGHLSVIKKDSKSNEENEGNEARHLA